MARRTIVELTDAEADKVMANLGCIKCHLFEAGVAWGKVINIIPASDSDRMQTAIKLAKEVLDDVLAIVQHERDLLTGQ